MGAGALAGMVALAGLVGVAGLTAGPATAAGRCYRFVVQQDEVVCFDQAGQVVSRTPITSPGPGQPPPDPSTLVEVPYLTQGLPNGGLCVAVAVVSVPGGPNSALAAQAEQTWLRLMGRYRLCPVPPPGPSVTAYAEAFIRTIALPVPQPRVAPGYAITGKTGYLETRSTLAPDPVVQTTPFGPLHVVITGEYFVHWGDEPNPAAFAGPFSQQGAPWPDGTITHTWDRAGPMTIVVEARWTATWQLGPESGVVANLTTRAVVAGFPVESLQAVIG
jgi:hypothetical protein